MVEVKQCGVQQGDIQDTLDQVEECSYTFGMMFTFVNTLEHNVAMGSGREAQGGELAFPAMKENTLKTFK